MGLIQGNSMGSFFYESNAFEIRMKNLSRQWGQKDQKNLNIAQKEGGIFCQKRKSDQAGGMYDGLLWQSNLLQTIF